MRKALLYVWMVALMVAVMEDLQAAAPANSAVAQRPPRVQVGPRTRPHSPELTEQQEEELLNALKDKLPGLHRHLQRMRKDKPRVYHKLLGETWQWYQHWKDLPPNVQQAAVAIRIEPMRIQRIVRAVREAKDAKKRAALQQRLEQAVAKEFDAQQVLAAHRLEKLKDRIARLEQKLKDRATDREKIVRNRVEDHLTAKAQAHPGGPDSRPASND